MDSQIYAKSTNNFPKKDSRATYKNLHNRFKKRASYSLLGGFIDVGLLGGDHYKIRLVAGESLL